MTTLLLGSGSAFAQEAQSAGSSAESGSLLETVTVQARRRDEDLQSVPVAVTALTDADIKSQDLSDVFRLARTVPSFNFCCKQGSVSPFVWVRGIQGVVYYFADAPFSAGGYGTTFDLENVQMLKGPQGTLFGIASNGGAVLYSPKRPTTETDAYAEVIGGNYNRLTMEGGMNFSMLDDRLLMRLSVKKHDRDGYIENLQDGQDYEDQHYVAARASIVAKITDDIENYTVLNYYDFHQRPTSYGPLTAVNPNGAARRIYGPALDEALLTQQRIGIYKREGYSIYPDVDPYSRSRQTNLVNTTTINFNDSLSVKNIFALQRSSSFSLVDGDETPFTIEDGGQPDDTFAGPQKTWSDELQFSGTLGEARNISYQFGGFYTEDHNDPTIDFSRNQDVRSAGETFTWSRTKAIYAQGTYNFQNAWEGLSATAGYRYTWDWRRQLNLGFNAASLDVIRVAPGEGDWQAGSYTLGLQYQFSPDTMMYFTNSKGYASGGLAVTAPPQFRSYDPESLNNFEVGFKSTFNVGDTEIRTNVAAYYGLYDDVVVQVSRDVQVDPPPAPRVYQIVRENAAKADISGAELEFTIVPSQKFEFGGFVSYNEFKFTKWDSINPATGLQEDLKETEIQYTPAWKWGLNTRIGLPIIPDAWGRLSLGAHYTYAGTVYDTLIPQRNAIKGIHTQSPLRNLDGTIDWADVFGRSNLTAQFYVTNALENEISWGLRAAYESVGFFTVLPAEPRMYGLRLRYDF